MPVFLISREEYGEGDERKARVSVIVVPLSHAAARRNPCKKTLCREAQEQSRRVAL